MTHIVVFRNLDSHDGFDLSLMQAPAGMSIVDADRAANEALENAREQAEETDDEDFDPITEAHAVLEAAGWTYVSWSEAGQ